MQRASPNVPLNCRQDKASTEISCDLKATSRICVLINLPSWFKGTFVTFMDMIECDTVRFLLSDVCRCLLLITGAVFVLFTSQLPSLWGSFTLCVSSRCCRAYSESLGSCRTRRKQHGLVACHQVQLIIFNCSIYYIYICFNMLRCNHWRFNWPNLAKQVFASCQVEIWFWCRTLVFHANLPSDMNTTTYLCTIDV